MPLPPSPPVNIDNIESLGLTLPEFERIQHLLGRNPNWTELGIFSVMWSEHCSYKSSKVHLKNLPTEGPRVVQGPGENAGVVDIGDGKVAVFKIESHNHPSFVEPFQGAATGVGGILRDIFTMGARPIALLNSLRFGDPEEPRTRYLLRGVVNGISSYGNCVGVPNVGGEINFDFCYDNNNLVNVFCLGVADKDRIFLGNASGVGNSVLYVGSKTGRDGIHGASLLASSEFDEATEAKRPTVQVGDPFTEKLLIEACLEAMEHDWIVGIQDMGAAGLTSSSFEMADRSGTGVELDLSKVPMRETGMTAFEILLSESQERMLFVIEKGHEEEAKKIFEKWGLDAVVIGKVTDTGAMRMTMEGEEVVNLPIHAVVESAPQLVRPTKKPNYIEAVNTLNLNLIPDLERGEGILKLLLKSLNIADKSWAYKQYDHMVGINTLVMPGSDAAVIRVKETNKALAISVDCNSRYCHLNPFRGAQIAVAECFRNISCSGGVPIGLTNCLNFGNPEKPEIMWQFEQAVLGIGNVCNYFSVPIVSGNVSLYNETKGKSIYPTPVVAAVGLLEDQTKHCTQWFKNSGDHIALLGLTLEEISGTDYLENYLDLCQGSVPALDVRYEKKLHELCVELIQNDLIQSAHDCSEGGLAVTIAESCFSGPNQTLGATIKLESSIRNDALMFGESQSRIIISYSPDKKAIIEERVNNAGLDFSSLGTVGGNDLTVQLNDKEFIKEKISTLEEAWREPLKRYGG
jgi:phosphoribosylformylglycinamidine synthase subunit PurL